jgi:hypothetical protein
MAQNIVDNEPVLKGKTITELPKHLVKNKRIRVVPSEYIRPLKIQKNRKGSKINPFATRKWKYEPSFEFDLKAQFKDVTPQPWKPLMTQAAVERLDGRVMPSTPETGPHSPGVPGAPRHGPVRGDIENISVIDLTHSPEVIDLTHSPEVIDLTHSPEVIDLTHSPETIDLTSSPSQAITPRAINFGSPKSVVDWVDVVIIDGVEMNREEVFSNDFSDLGVTI